MLESFVVVLYFGTCTDRTERMSFQHPSFMFILLVLMLINSKIIFCLLVNSDTVNKWVSRKLDSPPVQEHWAIECFSVNCDLILVLNRLDDDSAIDLMYVLLSSQMDWTLCD